MNETEHEGGDEWNAITDYYVPFFQLSKIDYIKMEEKCKHHVAGHSQSPVRISRKEPFIH